MSASDLIPDLPEPDDDLRALLGRLPQGADGPIHLMAVMAHHPALLRAWGRYTGALLGGLLSAADRERVILRSAWVTRSSYEWGHHVAVGRAAGLSDTDILACRGDAAAAGPHQLLFQAVDEAHTAGAVKRETLRSLVEERSVAEAIEVVFLAGTYGLVASAVRSLSIRDDAGLPAFGELT